MSLRRGLGEGRRKKYSVISMARPQGHTTRTPTIFIFGALFGGENHRELCPGTLQKLRFCSVPGSESSGFSTFSSRESARNSTPQFFPASVCATGIIIATHLGASFARSASPI